MTNPSIPVAFEISRIGQKEPEMVQADSVDEIDGKYVFRKNGTVVRELFKHALEIEPKPIYPRTPEQKKKWREFVQKNNAAMRTPNLKRD